MIHDYHSSKTLRFDSSGPSGPVQHKATVSPNNAADVKASSVAQPTLEQSPAKIPDLKSESLVHKKLLEVGTYDEVVDNFLKTYPEDDLDEFFSPPDLSQAAVQGDHFGTPLENVFDEFSSPGLPKVLQDDSPQAVSPPQAHEVNLQRDLDVSNPKEMLEKIAEYGPITAELIMPDSFNELASEFLSKLTPGNKKTGEFKNILDEMNEIKKFITDNNNLTIDEREVFIKQLIDCKDKITFLVDELGPKESKLAKVLIHLKKVNSIIEAMSHHKKKLPEFINKIVSNVNHLRGMPTAGSEMNQLKPLIESFGQQLFTTITFIELAALETQLKETKMELEAMQTKLTEKTAMTAVFTSITGSEDEKKLMLDQGPHSSKKYPNLKKQKTHDQAQSVFQDKLDQVSAFGWRGILEKSLENPTQIRAEIHSRIGELKKDLEVVNQKIEINSNNLEQLQKEMKKSNNLNVRADIASKIEDEVRKQKTLFEQLNGVKTEQGRLIEAHKQLTITSAERADPEKQSREFGPLAQQQFSDLFIDAQVTASDLTKGEFQSLHSAYDQLPPHLKNRFNDKLNLIQALQQDSLVSSIEYQKGMLFRDLVKFRKTQVSAGIATGKAAAAVGAAAHIVAVAKIATVAATALASPVVGVPLTVVAVAVGTHALVSKASEYLRVNSDFEKEKPLVIQEAFDELCSILDKSNTNPDSIIQSKNALQMMLHLE